MGKYPEELVEKMRHIYKAIMKRIRTLGDTDEADVLFIHLFKTEIEQNTDYQKEQ